MTGGSEVQRALRAEELYTRILSFVSDNAWTTEEEVRGLLDVIFLLGKIDGRMTVYSSKVAAEGDRLIEAWQQIVDSVD